MNIAEWKKHYVLTDNFSTQSDRNIIIGMLKNGMDINAELTDPAGIAVMGEDKYTLWSLIVESNNFDLLAQALKYQPDIDAPFSFGPTLTALGYLIDMGRNIPDTHNKATQLINLMREVLKSGADTKRYLDLFPPLQIIADYPEKSKKLAIILGKLLIENGADINAHDNQELSGNTPIMTASYNAHSAIVKFFVNNGANLKKKNVWGESALHNLVIGHLFNPEYNSISARAFTLKVLLNKGVDLDAKDNKGDTALLFTVKQAMSSKRNDLNPNLDMMSLLLEHGADPDARDAYENTAIDFLLGEYFRDLVKKPAPVQGAGIQMVELLLQKGATVKTVYFLDEMVKMTLGSYSSCPLLQSELFRIALRRGETESVRLLLSRENIKTNAANPDGFTPAYLASYHGHSEIACLLTAHTALQALARARKIDWADASILFKYDNDKIKQTRDIVVKLKDKILEGRMSFKEARDYSMEKANIFARDSVWVLIDAGVLDKEQAGELTSDDLEILDSRAYITPEIVDEFSIKKPGYKI